MADAIDTIIEILSPYLGAHMSRMVVTGSLEKMGKPRDQVTRVELDKLVHQLGLGLNVFVGRDVSAKIVTELKLKLGLGPGASSGR
jgi:hypothetical protein